MHSQVTLALIGRGHWGQVYQKNIQALALQKMPDGIPGISLPDANIYGRDYQEGLKQLNPRDIDGVIIAVSTSAHYEVATYLLQHGFQHLLIEKPLTRTHTEAMQLQNLAHAIPESLIMVDHTLLYDPAYIKMKEVVPRTIGKLLQVTYTSLKAPKIEGDTIIPDAGSPPLYLFMDILGKNPHAVSAQPTTNDNVEITLKFAGGVQAIAHIGTIYPERKRVIAFIGERGMLTLNEFMNPRELIFTNQEEHKEQIEFSTSATALQCAIMEFASCIVKHTAPKTPLAAGADVVNLIELAEQSLKKGGTPIPFTSYSSSI